MNKKLFAPLLFFSIILNGCATIKFDFQIETGKKSESEIFHELLKSEWEKGIERNPEWASRLGDNRFNDKLNDASYETILNRQEEAKDLLEKVKKIDRADLDETDHLNYDLYLHGIQKLIEGYQFLSYLMPIDQMGGIQIGFAGISNYMPFNSEKDYENYLSRLAAFPTKINQTIDLMKRGIETGWVPPKIVLGSVPVQIKAHFEKPINESPLFKPFNNFPESMNEETQKQLTEKMKTILTEKVYPAYESLFTYFTESYLPVCRESIACKDFPNGDSYYKFKIKSYTTTDKTALEIHDIGLNEVARIRAEMMDVKDAAEFDGSFDEFLIFLRTDSQFYFTSETEFLNAYRTICKRADAELPKFFGLLPRLPYGVKPIPDYQAPASPTAYYYSGSHEAGRAGFFMANTYKLETRPKYEMEALSIHEAVPGHHLQITLAQEMENIPKFRRYGGYTAFVEGWGLYSEKLGEEMGFYDNPYSKFGQLTYEMWRACRLVVDTGMHAFGWSREKAIDYMLSNTAKTENDVSVEIDRYIAWPGQALAYKIGELKIRDLRAKAEKEMGEAFNIRDFHDVVLGQGAVPLNVLENHVNAYIQTSK